MSAPSTRADEASLIIGRLREGFHDLERCEVVVKRGVEPAIAALLAKPLLVYTITIVVDEPNEAAP